MGNNEKNHLNNKWSRLFYNFKEMIKKIFKRKSNANQDLSNQSINLQAIESLRIRYQPIILPNGRVIKKRCSRTIIDSRKKLKKLFLPVDLSGKTVLDIGCAEGFFLREAIERGAKIAKGIDISKQRVLVNRYINKLWGYSDKISVRVGNFMDLDEKYDIILCLSIIHHYQRTREGIKFLDTWRMITDDRYKYICEDHLKKIKKIASLTKEMTIFEYPYTYKGYKSKRRDIDFKLLGNLWVRTGIYKKVEFKGLSHKSRFKDRAIYLAYK